MPTVTGADVVAEARTQIGVRWVHQARMWGVALDCLGLVVCTARRLGLVAPDFDVNGYGRRPDGTMLDLCDRYMTRIPGLELGAVVCVATAQEPQHLAIVADYVHGGHSIVHATNAGRCEVTETRLVFLRTMRMRGIYRLPGVA